jgi:hypothetical protein
MYELAVGKDDLCSNEACPDESPRDEHIQKANPIQQPGARNANDAAKI